MMQHAWIYAGLSALILTACSGESAEPEAATPPAADAEVEAPQDQQPPEAPRSIPAPEGSLAGGAMTLGAADAPVKMVEYASVTCPGCAAFHRLGWPFVEDMLVETGRVNFEYREFPTPPQNLAYAGFYLARCTATSNGSPAYFKILDTLYARQREWATGPTPGAVFENIAAQAGIDRAGLENCFFREDIKEAVANNVKTGYSENVSRTPTFFVEDEEFDWGASPLAMLHNVEETLSAKGAALIPVGATSTIDMPIDFCGEIFKNTQKAVGGKAKSIEDTDISKIMRITSKDGGALVGTCTAVDANDPSTHTFSIAKVAAE